MFDPRNLLVRSVRACEVSHYGGYTHRNIYIIGNYISELSALFNLEPSSPMRISNNMVKELAASAGSGMGSGNKSSDSE